MDPMTGQIVRRDELDAMDPALRERFVEVPEELSEHAAALLEFRDRQRKLANAKAARNRSNRRRRRETLAKASRRRNRRG